MLPVLSIRREYPLPYQRPEQRQSSSRGEIRELRVEDCFRVLGLGGGDDAVEGGEGEGEGVGLELVVLGVDEGEGGIVFAREGGGGEAGEAEVGEGVRVGGWGVAAVFLGKEATAAMLEG